MSRSEEFDAGYRMQHQPFEASRFHEADKAYPDIYEHPEYYKTHDQAHDAESLSAIRGAKGNPEKKVRMYRAVPKHVNQINPGDWVTTSRSYAQDHAYGEKDWHILNAVAKANDLIHTGDSIHEQGYVGEHPKFKLNKQGGKAADDYWKQHGK
jgi:hypothetical protein